MDTKTGGNRPLLFSKGVTNAAKGIAVILMLIHHLFYCCSELAEQYGVKSVIFSLQQIYSISEVSKICVAVFVVLTAYGLTAGSASKKPDPVKRLKKLMPSFWVVYVVSILTCIFRPDHLAVYFQEGRFKGLAFMLLDACGVSSMVGTPTYNETWWYMSLAILLICLVPIIIGLYKQYGLCVLGVGAFLPYLLSIQTGSMYLFAAVLGVWAASSSFFGKLKAWAEKKTILLPLIAAVLLFAGCCIVRMKIGMTFWVDALAAFFLITVLFLLIDCGPLKLRLLLFLGEHSMNIFLVHTLIFEYYFTKYIYAPGNWLLITLALLISSLAVSVVLTPIQKLVLSKIK